MGDNSTSSTSRPLTAAERQQAYGGFLSTFAPDVMNRDQWERRQRLSGRDWPNNEALDADYSRYLSEQSKSGAAAATQGKDYVSPEYQDVTFTNFQKPRSLTNEDYGRLEQEMYASRAAPLEAKWRERAGDINQEMAARGVSRGGVPITEKSKVFAREFAPLFAQAASEAATQRYGAQGTEQQALNNLNTSQVNARNQFFQQSQGNKNQFNQAEAQQQYQSKWRPLDYLAGIYNGTGGVISSSSGGGWSI